jgi:hypothetical protein
MMKIKLPGFTAETSISKTAGQYWSVSYSGFLDKRILPQGQLVCILDRKTGQICCGIKSDEAGMSIPLGCTILQ